MKNKAKKKNKNTKKNKKNNRFPGFPSGYKANFWKYPRAMDKWWCILDGSEQKCLDFVLRRTWGFNKNEDFISKSQFMKGVGNLDNGTGLSGKTIIDALARLEKKRFIRIIKKPGKTNLYKLVQKKTNPVQKSNKTSSKNKQVASSDPKHTIKDITIEDNTINNNKTSYSIKKEVVPLYASLIIAAYKRINPKTEENEHSKKAVFVALDKYSIRELIRAIASKYNNKWWMENLNSYSIIWFLEKDDKLRGWIEESGEIDEDFLYNPSCMNVMRQIIKKEGKDNLKKIFPESSSWIGN